jgi:hypothetical protein
MTDTLLAQLDIRAAVEKELLWEPDLLPRSVGDRALATKIDVTAEQVAQLVQGGYKIGLAPIVFARKWRFGRRPVSALPLVERCIYRSVVDQLQEDLVPLERGGDHFDRFEEAPLALSSEFVVMTDLANYYSTINLERLSRELVERTGRWEYIKWLREFWTNLSGGYGGIPQMSQASDIIGDTFADELHRGLGRRGLTSWRYADDFRISANSEWEVLEALELFDEEARRLGLFVNERKTRVLSRLKYEQFVKASEVALAKISGEVSLDLAPFDPYGWIEVPSDEAGHFRALSLRLVSFWQESRHAGGNPMDEVFETVRLLGKALDAMTQLRDAAALPFVAEILRYEPQLTPGVIRYLASLLPADATVVGETLVRCLQEVPVTKWQQLWMLHLLESWSIDRNSSVGSRGTVLAWMKHCVQDHSEPLRCQAALALACGHDLTVDEWQGVQDRGGMYSEPFLAAAMLGTKGISRVSDPRPSGKLSRLIYEWVGDECLIFPF